ncbi:MAG: glycosyltransferase family A protein [Bacteroidota bacterium]
MEKITVVLPYSPEVSSGSTLQQWSNSPLVAEIIILHRGDYRASHPKTRGFACDSLTSRKVLTQLLSKISTQYLIFILRSDKVTLGQFSLEQLFATAENTRAGLIYGDYNEIKDGTILHHPLIDYQLGSVRDEFNFGNLLFFSIEAIRRAFINHGSLLDTVAAGLYDLRLKVSIDSPIVHLPEYLYTMDESDTRIPDEKMFDYVDSRNCESQIEMEEVFTAYLRRIGAFIEPSTLKHCGGTGIFPVEASVIIPVRNREKTIADALQSALSQKLAVPWNIIVVDNHSTDSTSAIVHEIAVENQRIIHHIPQQMDLGIGGCWNEAISLASCGRHAIQLDSDDLYASENTLQMILDVLHQKRVAMVIGSYRLVNFHLEDIPPGIIDHREWTPENGHNNALRVNGLGAPRAFYTGVVRALRFPNVSYGEDYAAGLAISRQYIIERIYEPLYLCRRWEGNSDTEIGVDNINRNDYYKDTIRSTEILARQKCNLMQE